MFHGQMNGFRCWAAVRFRPLVSLAVADWLVKLAQAVLALIPFRIVVRNLMQRRAQIN